MSPLRPRATRHPRRSALRSPRTVVATALALLAAGFASFAPVGPAQAASAAACKPPKYPSGAGGGYITSLKATGTSCSQGSKVAVAYTKCRTKKSKKGRCSGGVLGYKCTDKRGKAIPTEFSGRVTCKKSRATVVHTYQQNT